MVNVASQNTPYYYAFVSYDRANKKYIPIAEFITTRHDSDMISSYLVLMKKTLQRYMKPNSQFIIAPIIVVDFSWALINAVLDEFNDCTIFEYLHLHHVKDEYNRIHKELLEQNRFFKNI